MPLEDEDEVVDEARPEAVVVPVAEEEAEEAEAKALQQATMRMREPMHARRQLVR